jgi:hypothetical protein
MKTALSLTSCFQRQREAMLRAFGENGEFSKTFNICANFKNLFKNVGRTAFCIYYYVKDAKKSLKTDYENLVHVYL